MDDSALVQAREGKAVRLPGDLYMHGIHNCLGVVFYSPPTRVVGMAHVFDIAGEARFSGDNAVPSLLEKMARVDLGAIPANGIKAYLLGETPESIAVQGNRTQRVKAALRDATIPITYANLGSPLWLNIVLVGSSQKLHIRGYREAQMGQLEYHSELDCDIPLR